MKTFLVVSTLLDCFYIELHEAVTQKFFTFYEFTVTINGTFFMITNNNVFYLRSISLQYFMPCN